MDTVRIVILVVYFVCIAWLIHAPVDLGIQALHLKQEGKIVERC
jgi:preprotein translocase subunit SecE